MNYYNVTRKLNSPAVNLLKPCSEIISCRTLRTDKN